MAFTVLILPLKSLIHLAAAGQGILADGVYQGQLPRAQRIAGKLDIGKGWEGAAGA